MTALTAAQALTLSRRAEARRRLGRLGWVDAYMWALLVLIGAGVLAGLQPHAAGPAAEHQVTVTLPVVGAVIGAGAWGLYLTRSRWASSPFGFSLAEVHLLLTAPLSRADLFRSLARRRCLRLGFGAVSVATGLGLADTVLLHGGGALAFLGPLGSLLLMAAGWVWSGYSHHAPALVRILAVVVAGVIGLSGLAQPLAHLPVAANPGRVILALVVAHGPAPPAGLILAVSLMVLGVLGLWLATVWVPSVPVETIARRAPLVSQLRFALARGDTRAVSLLVRAGAAESLRDRPWTSWRPELGGATGAGLYALVSTAARAPAARWARLVLLLAPEALLVRIGLAGGGRLLLALAGLVGYLVGLGLLEATAELLDASDAISRSPSSLLRVAGVQVTVSLAVAISLGMGMTIGAPWWPVTAMSVGTAWVAGPLVSLVLGPPSMEFVTRLVFTSPESAFLLAALRYSIGILITVSAVVLTVGTAHYGLVGPVIVGLAGLVSAGWALRRGGGDSTGVPAWLAALLGVR